MRQFVSISTIVLFVVMGFMSGCSSAETANTSLPASDSFITPAGETAQVLLGSLVQIQTAHANADVQKVELWVQNINEVEPKLIAANQPQNGIATNGWQPQQAGSYTLKVRAFNSENSAQADLTRQIEVVDSRAVALSPEEPSASDLGETASFNSGGEPQTAPTPEPIEGNAPATNDGTIQIVDTQLTGQPTAAPRYPAPPPAPGVPPGPTQAELNNFGPPQCEAAEFVGIYASDTSRRVFITEPDDMAAQTVAGTRVHRAWKVRNIGTCTWGPGYELAFYGGRAMGSGGVSFEHFFPTEPTRRNVLLDQNQLVAPEGQPNQTAVLEVMLQAPTIPGVHQSYWRMRNPQGVFFGPIMGVTLDVVRECEFGIYGAPVINQFWISGVGNVYRPDNPVTVTIQRGQEVRLDWDVINAESFEIVFESPTNALESVTTTDPSSFAVFNLTELGLHTITLFADNGSCTFSQQVFVDVVPEEGGAFTLSATISEAAPTEIASNGEVAVSSALPANQVSFEWNHYNPSASDFSLNAEAYERRLERTCPIGWLIDVDELCYEAWSDWRQLQSQETAEFTAFASGTVTVANTLEQLCQSSGNSDRQQRRIAYHMETTSNVTPKESNIVEIPCPASN